MKESRRNKPGVFASVGAVAGLVSVTALQSARTIEDSFEVLNESVGLVKDTVVASRKVSQATLNGWVREAEISASIDEAYAEVELAKALIEIDEIQAEAKALKASRKAK